MKTFAIAGLGFVSERHLRAIKENDCELVAAINANDSVGILDKYFPNCQFFLDVEEFKNYIFGVDYLSICTPNNSHKFYIDLGHSVGAKIICEKPVILYPNDYDPLVSAILQLRLHENTMKIKGKHGRVKIFYSVKRGQWYFKSWKSDQLKSGGILFNLGIHLLDLMIYLFGDGELIIDELLVNRSSGRMRLENADVEFNLGICNETKREIWVNDHCYDFSDIDLHTLSYKEILNGNGFKDYDKVTKLLSSALGNRNY